MKRTYTFLIMLCLVTVITSFFFGAANLSPSEIWSALASPRDHTTSYSILIDIRLPRLIAAGACGIALALSGVILQSIFGNPIVDAAFIGVSGWASCGAALGLILIPTDTSLLTETLGAGLTSCLILGLLGRTSYRGLRFTLFGFALGALANATLAVLTSSQLVTSGRSLTSWLFGSLALATWSTVGLITVSLIFASLLLIGQTRNLDLISLGSTAATHLGIDHRKLRFRMLVATVLLVSPSVAAFGVIGFIGLAVPHLARRFGLVSHRHVLPLSALLGIIVMSLADLIARLGPGGMEIPLSLTLALCGAPVLLAALRRVHHD